MAHPQNRYIDMLFERATMQIAYEVSGNVDSIYGLILPKLLDDRIVQRDDEPLRTKQAISSFVNKVVCADIQLMEVTKYFGEAPLYNYQPAARLLTRVIYNKGVKPHEFNTIWVLHAGDWYTTATGKIWIQS